ncbi:MAG: sigma-E factor negative regulatory protein [Herbaspirillum sp.]|nr:sigma-E factor negative regulatory protein [Herbaspirillum sp.]
MDTKVTTREQISALADGELGSEEMTIAFAALRSSKEGQEAWEDYHRIGEVLRSEEMDVSLSAGFSAKMSAWLDAEPAIVAPQVQAAPAVQEAPAAQAAVAANGDHRAARPGRLVRLLMPSAAAAAAAVAAVFVAMPQQAVVTADAKVAAPAVQMAAAPVSVPSAIATVSDTNGNAQNVNQLSSLAQQGEVKRDPRIDDYLFAHQRFSPSYSSAQYARSAAFSTDADK